MRRLFLLFVLAGCDDHLFQPEGEGPAADWCGVEPVLAASCATSGCHDAGTAFAGLDLQTDPYAAIVDVPSTSAPELALVASGDPDGSLLLLKVEGNQPDGTGARMPVGTPLTEPTLAAMRTWIADGALPCEASP